MSDPVPPPPTEAKKSGSGCGWILFFGILILLCGIAIPPQPGGIRRAGHSAAMQQARQIDLTMFAYANDNQQKYPEGNSSTEVFQKLMDGGYISDPTLLYVPYPGKIKPAADQKKLKPENVSFDVTCCIDASSPDSLPVVFLTGYKISYVPGGAALQLPLSRAQSVQTWSEWFSSRSPNEEVAFAGIAVANKGNNARFTALTPTSAEDKSIPNFIPPDCQLNGKTYRQLTPDGPLPP